MKEAKKPKGMRAFDSLMNKLIKVPKSELPSVKKKNRKKKPK